MNSRIITLSLALGLLGGITELSALPQKPTRKVQTSRPAASKLQQDFLAKQKAFPKGDFFRIFKQQMTPEERDAMTFLYAYMPTNDLIDRDGDFYLENVRASLRARKELPWGKSIPEREWKHFVLPIRVNNEALDASRMVFFDALKDRVKGLSLHDAVLEVNHWCHEHVVYTPSDSRTSSPLATIRSAYGRCGEESTLLVAALRAVGIPARQVYTPRWAHTDDNHAWEKLGSMASGSSSEPANPSLYSISHGSTLPFPVPCSFTRRPLVAMTDQRKLSGILLPTPRSMSSTTMLT